ncbi:hypothetical protein [Chondromyces crocatus]|uniref:Uncharacterized protein n=1 Tax=Chondromyces crocatus TaxID=52 RepID=A0A0K1ELX2_CHOCO|nr:hypothetical protein [Chondromyces crocatus]AKT41859.1 uncharacterized protein CMC5_060800 [Chondromyces crocatus]
MVSSTDEPPASDLLEGSQVEDASPVRASGGQGSPLGAEEPGDQGSRTEEAKVPLTRAFAGFRDVRTIQAMLAALVAWSITIAPAAFARGSLGQARFVAVLALACGLAAPPLALVRRRLGRHLGISVFVALASLTWLLSSTALQPLRLDPIRAAIGAIAWGVFALSWRDRWSSGPSQTPETDAPVLQARSRLPPTARLIASIGVLSALGLLFLAWRVREVDRGLMAQAVAIACAIALMTAAADVAVALGRRTQPPRRLTPHGMKLLLGLLVFAVGGAVLLAIR